MLLENQQHAMTPGYTYNTTLQSHTVSNDTVIACCLKNTDNTVQLKLKFQCQYYYCKAKLLLDVCIHTYYIQRVFCCTVKTYYY